MCGYDNAVFDPSLPNFSERQALFSFVTAANVTVSVCVAACPTSTEVGTAQRLSRTRRMACCIPLLLSLSLSLSLMQTATLATAVCLAGVQVESDAELIVAIRKGLCAPGTFASSDSLNHCVPDSDADWFWSAVERHNFTSLAVSRVVYALFNDVSVGTRIVGDMSISYQWILCCAAAALMVSALWCLLLFLVQREHVLRITLTGLLVALLSNGVFFYAWWSEYTFATSRTERIHAAMVNVWLLLAMALASLTITLALFALTVHFRKTLLLASLALSHTRPYIRRAPSLLFALPIAIATLFAASFAYNIVAIAELASAGHTTTSLNGTHIHSSPSVLPPPLLHFNQSS